jgi:hypothetical protein
MSAGEWTVECPDIGHGRGSSSSSDAIHPRMVADEWMYLGSERLPGTPVTIRGQSRGFAVTAAV